MSNSNPETPVLEWKGMKVGKLYKDKAFNRKPEILLLVEIIDLGRLRSDSSEIMALVFLHNQKRHSIYCAKRYDPRDDWELVK